MSEPCKHPPGVVAPVIDRNRCEAKEDCVRVCPYSVFEIQPLGAAERSALSFVGRLKAWAHGNRQAYAVRASDCHGCGLCVTACPEDAIRLERV
jgi:4Fe-4S ferredoxin